MDDRTLEQRKGAWPDPGPDATYLVRTAHASRRVPVGRLSVEQLRLLIGQEISVDVLLPVAVRRLVVDPLVAGDSYPGDLLTAVMRLPTEVWRRHPGEEAALHAAVRDLDPGRPDLVDDRALADAVAAFLAG